MLKSRQLSTSKIKINPHLQVKRSLVLILAIALLLNKLLTAYTTYTKTTMMIM